MFPDTAGGCLRRTNFLHRVYEPIRTKAGLPDVHFHDWRHFHASRLIELGASPKVVQERIGHADVSTTLRFYVHTREQSHRAAADQFDAGFRPKRREGKRASGADGA